MVAVVTFAVEVEQRVLCENTHCRRPIASWDGQRLIVDRKGMYVEIPGGRAVIQCPHSTRMGSVWVPCGRINRVNLG